MTRTRIVAALAAILTALLLQATVVAPAAVPFAVSLPAVLVAAVAYADGPGTGMAFGFTTGLLADLGTTHPAGVLALCWTFVGVICGLRPARARLRRSSVVAAAVCTAAASAAILLLALVGSGGVDVATAVTQAPGVLLGDLLLAVVLIPLVGRLLRTEHLRAPQPVLTDLRLEAARG